MARFAVLIASIIALNLLFVQSLPLSKIPKVQSKNGMGLHSVRTAQHVDLGQLSETARGLSNALVQCCNSKGCPWVMAIIPGARNACLTICYTGGNSKCKNL